jgi:hypothetical protein
MAAMMSRENQELTRTKGSSHFHLLLGTAICILQTEAVQYKTRHIYMYMCETRRTTNEKLLSAYTVQP